jgi:hypothetical protein
MAFTSLSLARGALRGHLDSANLARELARIEAALPERHGRVLLDCREMTSYDLDARHAFVEWNARVRARLAGVAILTREGRWWMVIAAMAMAARMPMKGFADEALARVWLESTRS